MGKNEPSPLFTWTVIISVVGILLTKFIDNVGKEVIIRNTIYIAIILGITSLLIASLVCYMRSFEQYENNKKYLDKSKTLFNTSLISLLLFLVARIIETKNKDFFNQNFLAHMIISAIILSYFIFLIIKSLIIWNRKRKELKKQYEKEVDDVLKFLNYDLGGWNIKILERISLMHEYKIYSDKIYKKFGESIHNKRLEFRDRIKNLTKEQEIMNINKKIREALQDLKELEERKKRELTDPEQEKRDMANEMNVGKTRVYKKEELNDKQIDMLKENDYVQVNEYCLVEKRVIPVFVLNVMNHSPTHTFLVWSLQQFLEQDFAQIENIEIHDTRDADLTFKYHKMYYAIEVETGSQLKDNRRLVEKTSYLNSKYPKRWFFVVSNKNLQAQYNKFGLSTQRIGVEKTLQKMLKTSTHQKRVEP